MINNNNGPDGENGDDNATTTTYNNNNNNNNNCNWTKRWYEHVPESVETSQGGKVTILWYQQVQTDRTIPNNYPDIIIGDIEKGTCMLIDVTISGDRNVIKKELEKILKYKDLTIEIQRTCNVKTQVIPVIVGANGTISK